MTTDRDRRRFLRSVCGGAVGFLAGSALSCKATGTGRSLGEEPLNVVFILADDLGWADLSCYGNNFHETPIIDRLAAEGMRFTNAYAAAPICSPTRASIMTGQWPARVGLTDFIPGHKRPWARLIPVSTARHLPDAAVTVPEAVGPLGYTTAYFGKWHMGWTEQTNPKALFDVTGPVGENQGDKRVSALTEASVRFIEQNRDRPFFLYLAHHTPHIPLEAPAHLVKKYEQKLAHMENPPEIANPVYAAMLEHMDDSVGRILSTLEEQGIAGRTAVIFCSDNGGLRQRFDGQGPLVTTNAPLRDEKGSLYEGGIRVPLIARVPGLTSACSLCREPVSSVDMWPTFLDLCGGAGTRGQMSDGLSLLPLFAGSGLPRESLYWHYPHYHHTSPCGAVRRGDYKLIEFFEDGRLELYDMANDIGEQNDLSAQMPQRTRSLQRELSRWRQQVHAAMPEPNPDCEPERAGQWG